MMHTWREVGKVALGLATLVREGRLELPWVAPLDPKSNQIDSRFTSHCKWLNHQQPRQVFLVLLVFSSTLLTLAGTEWAQSDRRTSHHFNSHQYSYG